MRHPRTCMMLATWHLFWVNRSADGFRLSSSLSTFSPLILQQQHQQQQQHRHRWRIPPQPGKVKVYEFQQRCHRGQSKGALSAAVTDAEDGELSTISPTNTTTTTATTSLLGTVSEPPLPSLDDGETLQSSKEEGKDTETPVLEAFMANGKESPVVEKPTMIPTTLTSSTTTTPMPSSSKPNFLTILWRFTRPHTLIGSAVAVLSLHLLAAPSSLREAFTVSSAVSLVYAMIPSLLMNLYITGLNQITDVEIDRINKPQLPIPAGHLSRRSAAKIVTVALLLSLVWGKAHPVWGSNGLNLALWGSALLGTLYSLPPFRLKRFPVLAAFCIVAVRGTLINTAFYTHAKTTAYGGAVGASSWFHYLRHDARCLWSSLYFAIFGVVIALMKDVPDVKGDELLQIRSFSVRVGPSRIFRLVQGLLLTLLLGVGVGFVQQGGVAAMLFPNPRWEVVVGRFLVGTLSFAGARSVWRQGRFVNAKDPQQVYPYYMHLWKWFYISYLALPFVR